ncbi:MAG: dihydrofolate reductase [Flavisolibacter sp.]|nr:dihydrofolate reductase [Flavisolibacter sp.]MBD0377239.1 dihydrofolate reductase [Flavisolibacter sp.]
MRKVILNLAVSLDGFIEGPNGEFDWCFADQDYGMKEFYKRVDSIFMGRKSYELVSKMGENAYPGKKVYVFSRTLKKTANAEEIIAEDFENKVQRIKSSPGKDIWLFGGASLISSFVNSKLVDELMLSVHPILLGRGKPLFAEINDRTSVKFIQAKTYSSGLVQLFYSL